MRTPLTADVVSERLAYLNRQRQLLEWEIEHAADEKPDYALSCIAELQLIEDELTYFRTLKYSQRAKPQTITFQRNPGRVAQSVGRLDKAVKSLDDTRPGFQWLAGVIVRKWNDALDDMHRMGRRKADRKRPQLLKNTSSRIH